MERDEEMRIVQRVLSGDTNAFELLVLEYQQPIYNLALRMTGGSEDDARDLAQDAFVRAFNSLGSFRGDSRFSVWMYRLTSNICLDFLRSRRRRKTVSLSYFSGDDGEEAELEIPDDRFSPAGELERRELKNALNRALGRLPDEQRQVLLMREIGGMSYDEIALSLSLEPGTVKSRIFRARKKLCSIIVNDGNFSDYISSKGTKEV